MPKKIKKTVNGYTFVGLIVGKDSIELYIENSNTAIGFFNPSELDEAIKSYIQEQELQAIANEIEQKEIEQTYEQLISKGWEYAGDT